MSAQTLRQAMVELLSQAPRDARELSRRLHISEKMVYANLPHVARTAKTRGLQFIIEPACCLDCGYRFNERQRVTPPGKCPACRRTHLDPPAYRIE